MEACGDYHCNFCHLTMPRYKILDVVRFRRIKKRGMRSKMNPDIITVQQAMDLKQCPNCDHARFRYRKFFKGETYNNLVTRDWAYTMNCDMCGYLIGRIMKKPNPHTKS